MGISGAAALVSVLMAGTQAVAQAAAAQADSAAHTLTSPAVVQQPRPFGYVLGDTLIQRVFLGPAGHEFQPAALPPSERAGLWFARRSSKVERTEDSQRWLVIEYQLVNAPQTLLTLNLPAVALVSKNGTVLAVPEWPISAGPLTPRAAFAKGGLQELRPDHSAPMLPTWTLRRQAEIWTCAFALSIVSWFGWWLIRTLRSAANQPFANAVREICRSGDDSAAAWLALHRAFDRSAGRALQPTTLPALFEHAPHFESQRAAIEQFYAESNLRFFGEFSMSASALVQPTANNRPTQSGPPSAAPTTSLRTLATILRRLERQHEP